MKFLVTYQEYSNALKPALAAYVGRLQKGTTEEELTEYVSNVGMRGVVCKKLVAKNGKAYNTAVFYVTCRAQCKDPFFVLPPFPLPSP